MCNASFSLFFVSDIYHVRQNTMHSHPSIQAVPKNTPVPQQQQQQRCLPSLFAPTQSERRSVRGLRKQSRVSAATPTVDMTTTARPAALVEGIIDEAVSTMQEFVYVGGTLHHTGGGTVLGATEVGQTVDQNRGFYQQQQQHLHHPRQQRQQPQNFHHVQYQNQSSSLVLLPPDGNANANANTCAATQQQVAVDSALKTQLLVQRNLPESSSALSLCLNRNTQDIADEIARNLVEKALENDRKKLLRAKASGSSGSSSNANGRHAVAEEEEEKEELVRQNYVEVAANRVMEQMISELLGDAVVDVSSLVVHGCGGDPARLASCPPDTSGGELLRKALGELAAEFASDLPEAGGRVPEKTFGLHRSSDLVCRDEDFLLPPPLFSSDRGGGGGGQAILLELSRVNSRWKGCRHDCTPRCQETLEKRLSDDIDEMMADEEEATTAETEEERRRRLRNEERRKRNSMGLLVSSLQEKVYHCRCVECQAERRAKGEPEPEEAIEVREVELPNLEDLKEIPIPRKRGRGRPRKFPRLEDVLRLQRRRESAENSEEAEDEAAEVAEEKYEEEVVQKVVPNEAPEDKIEPSQVTSEAEVAMEKATPQQCSSRRPKEVQNTSSTIAESGKVVLVIKRSSNNLRTGKDKENNKSDALNGEQGHDNQEQAEPGEKLTSAKGTARLSGKPPLFDDGDDSDNQPLRSRKRRRGKKTTDKSQRLKNDKKSLTASPPQRKPDSNERSQSSPGSPTASSDVHTVASSSSSSSVLSGPASFASPFCGSEADHQPLPFAMVDDEPDSDEHLEKSNRNDVAAAEGEEEEAANEEDAEGKGKEQMGGSRDKSSSLQADRKIPAPERHSRGSCSGNQGEEEKRAVGKTTHKEEEALPEGKERREKRKEEKDVMGGNWRGKRKAAKKNEVEKEEEEEGGDRRGGESAKVSFHKEGRNDWVVSEKRDKTADMKDKEEERFGRKSLSVQSPTAEFAGADPGRCRRRRRRRRRMALIASLGDKEEPDRLGGRGCRHLKKSATRPTLEGGEAVDSAADKKEEEEGSAVETMDEILAAMGDDEGDKTTEIMEKARESDSQSRGKEKEKVSPSKQVPNAAFQPHQRQRKQQQQQQQQQHRAKLFNNGCANSQIQNCTEKRRYLDSSLVKPCWVALEKLKVWEEGGSGAKGGEEDSSEKEAEDASKVARGGKLNEKDHARSNSTKKQSSRAKVGKFVASSDKKTDGKRRRRRKRRHEVGCWLLEDEVVVGAAAAQTRKKEVFHAKKKEEEEERTDTPTQQQQHQQPAKSHRYWSLLEEVEDQLLLDSLS